MNHTHKTNTYVCMTRTNFKNTIVTNRKIIQIKLNDFCI